MSLQLKKRHWTLAIIPVAIAVTTIGSSKTQAHQIKIIIN